MVSNRYKPRCAHCRKFIPYLNAKVIWVDGIYDGWSLEPPEPISLCNKCYIKDKILDLSLHRTTVTP